VPRAQAPPGSDEINVLPPVTPDIAAEAAVWVARLHGPDRSAEMERECLAWQASSAVHREAFERCTDTWQDVARMTLSDYAASGPGQPSTKSLQRSPVWARWSVALATVCLVATGLAVLQPWRDIRTYTTAVGEQRTVILRDGTRMTLNTSTLLQVELTTAQRTVRLESGEALFEVAKDARRPFVVRAADRVVTALGTVFSVRTAPDSPSQDALAVTLIEGRVSIQPVPTGGTERATTPGPLILQPGERVRFTEGADTSNGSGQAMRVDRPRIDQVVAWRRNEAIFDNVSLADAVADMNRYSRTPIVLVGDKAVEERRISGSFRTGDSAAFAQAVAALHGLNVHEGPGRLELSLAEKTDKPR
jgi:transmembrane sensor